jgi:hypoxanthine phosphoribosyltransferase
MGMKANIKDRHVIIIEDIIDSGNTIVKVLNFLKEKEPASIKIASLLFKNEALKHDINPEFVGFSNVPNKFVLGYGNIFKKFLNHKNTLKI